MPTKKDCVDFIAMNFTRSDGKKVFKKELNKETIEHLEHIIATAGYEQRFKDYLNQQKQIKFYAECTDEKGNDFTYTVTKPSFEDAINDLRESGMTVTTIVQAKGHHLCRYCKSIADGGDKDKLCYECQSLFGHTYYWEL